MLLAAVGNVALAATFTLPGWDGQEFDGVLNTSITLGAALRTEARADDNVQSVGGVPEVIYHFNSGRYFVTAMANEDKPNDFSVHFPEEYFESATVQKKSLK